MVLVAKIYAPTAVERSLCVFCCNKRACSLDHKGWQVIRNQADAVDTIPPAPVASCQPVLEAPAAAASASSSSSVWASLGSDSLASADDELAQLLNARDCSLARLPGPGPGPGTKKAGGKAKSSQPIKEGKQIKPEAAFKTVTALRKIVVEEVAEPWMDWDADDVAPSDHIDRLLQSYLQDEDDAQNMVALRAAGVGSIAVEGGDLPVVGGEAEDDEDDAEEAALAGNDTERYFQRRVSAQPDQLLRYAYGGVPLWISSPNPLSRSDATSGEHPLVPCCESCGSKRVFECQLMPALLSHISSKSASRKDSGQLVAAKDQLAEILGTGLDFGVVTIWSCPNSCSLRSSTSGSFLTEVAVVQPPPDFSSPC